MNDAWGTTPAWAPSVVPLPSSNAGNLSAGLSTWQRRGAEEQPVPVLAETLADSIRANPTLIVRALNGTGPRVRLAGYAILDGSTREALLVWGWIVMGTVD